VCACPIKELLAALKEPYVNNPRCNRGLSGNKKLSALKELNIEILSPFRA